MRGDGDAALLEVLSAVIVYLAVRPERRRVEQAVVGEALGEEYGEELPDEIAEWPARQASPAAELRRHGARQPRRNFHARPSAPEDG